MIGEMIGGMIADMIGGMVGENDRSNRVRASLLQSEFKSSSNHKPVHCIV